jgi:hypothetical protein
MSDPKQPDLERQLEEARKLVGQLEEERTRLRQEVAQLGNQLDNYKPMAQAWMVEHMPSKEECEKILNEMLAHPEKLLDFQDVVRELVEEFGEPKSGENAA